LHNAKVADRFLIAWRIGILAISQPPTCRVRLTGALPAYSADLQKPAMPLEMPPGAQARAAGPAKRRPRPEFPAEASPYLRHQRGDDFIIDRSLMAVH